MSEQIVKLENGTDKEIFYYAYYDKDIVKAIALAEGAMVAGFGHGYFNCPDLSAAYRVYFRLVPIISGGDVVAGNVVAENVVSPGQTMRIEVSNGNSLTDRIRAAKEQAYQPALDRLSKDSASE